MKKHIALHVAMATAFALIGTTAGWYAHSWSSVEMTERNSTHSDQQDSIESSVYLELRNNVGDGTTIDELREIVGDSFIKQNYKIPEEISESFHQTLVVRGVAPEPDDEYCALLLGSRTLILHLRDGRVVNLRPEADFANPEDVEFMISMHNFQR